MIDSTGLPPKKVPVPQIAKLLSVSFLALLLVACAAGSDRSATGAAATADEQARPSETAEAGTPSDATRDEGTEETPSEDAPEAESGERSDRADGRRPKRVVLETVYDDRRVGEEQDDAVEAELGLVHDEELLAYVRSVGIRLVRYAPERPFDYEFKIVDASIPNAFALPGGKIYVSRGLLALVQTEDELAAVLGHEITHAAERHTAARIDYASRINPFSIGFLRAAAIAAYGRDQERDADRGGQILAASAGYDPAGIATFLRKLDASDRYELGWSRLPSFLASHPTSPERAALAADRAAGLKWERRPAVAADRPLAYLSVVDGLVLGDNPSGGLFVDDEGRFVHPDLGFSIRFPRGWETFNTPQAVAAISPTRDAQATLTVEGEGTDIGKVVDDFLDREVDGTRVDVRERREIRLGDLPAIRIEGRARNGLVSLTAQMTFVAFEGLVYRLSVLSLSGAATSKYRGRAHAFAHSFRPLDHEGLYSLQVVRLRIARALEDETLQELSARTKNVLDVVYTGVMNDLYATNTLARGTPVKIGLAEPYIPTPREATPESANGAGEPGDENAEPDTNAPPAGGEVPAGSDEVPAGSGDAPAPGAPGKD
jgi:predicted Zn-dependent protease